MFALRDPVPNEELFPVWIKEAFGYQQLHHHPTVRKSGNLFTSEKVIGLGLKHHQIPEESSNEVEFGRIQPLTNSPSETKTAYASECPSGLEEQNPLQPCFPEAIVVKKEDGYALGKTECAKDDSSKDIDTDDPDNSSEFDFTGQRESNTLKDSCKNDIRFVCGELKYVCPKCSKQFSIGNPHNYYRHLRIHMGVYTHICKVCGRGFFRKEHYHEHKCYSRSRHHRYAFSPTRNSDLLRYSKNILKNKRGVVRRTSCASIPKCGTAVNSQLDMFDNVPLKGPSESSLVFCGVDSHCHNSETVGKQDPSKPLSTLSVGASSVAVGAGLTKNSSQTESAPPNKRRCLEQMLAFDSTDEDRSDDSDVIIVDQRTDDTKYSDVKATKSLWDRGQVGKECAIKDMNMGQGNSSSTSSNSSQCNMNTHHHHKSSIYISMSNQSHGFHNKELNKSESLLKISDHSKQLQRSKKSRVIETANVILLNDQQVYECPDCKSTFKHTCNYIRHRKIHEGIKPHICSECGKGFFRNEHLRKHLETHKRQTFRDFEKHSVI